MYKKLFNRTPAGIHALNIRYQTFSNTVAPAASTSLWQQTLKNVQKSQPQQQNTPQVPQGTNITSLPSGSNYQAKPVTPTVTTPPPPTQPTNIGYGNTLEHPGTSMNPPAPTTPPASSYTAPATALGSIYNATTGIGTGTSGAGANTGLYQQWLQGQATGQNPAQTSIKGLQGIAQNGSPQVQQATKNIAGLMAAQNLAASDPNFSQQIASGRAQNIGNEINAANVQMQNALGQQGQQITAANDAGSQALTGQSQQIGASGAAAGLGLTQQNQQVTALNNAGSLASPQSYAPTSTPYNPVESNFTGGGNAQINRAVNGANTVSAGDFTTKINDNTATLNAINGSNGQPGMVDNFNSSLKQSGLNSSNINLQNALTNGLSANTSGPYAALQTQFQNIMHQYASPSLLGPQVVSDLIKSSQTGTIADFLSQLNTQAQAVQNGLKTAIPGQSSSGSGGTITSSAGNSYKIPYTQP